MSIFSQHLPTTEELFDVIRHTSSTIWGDLLSEKKILEWLENFKGEVFPIEEEQLLALWLLSNFTYYNPSEVEHLCKVVYRLLKREVILENNNNSVNIDSQIKNFFLKTNIISSGTTSESGGVISFIFRTQNDLPIELFRDSINAIDPNIQNIVIIDDVALTSNSSSQAYNFFKDKLNQYPNKKFYYLTLICYKEAAQFLEECFQNLKIISAIKLDNRDKCFSNESHIFNSFPEIINDAKKFVLHYGLKIDKRIPLGYKNGEYTFGFYYNTPDNTLPIFWGTSNNWVSIITRYNKNYQTATSIENEEKFL